jgi:hypothetical protein
MGMNGGHRRNLHTWSRRSWGRVAWIVGGIGFYGSAILEMGTHAGRADPCIGLGVLEGTAWAVRGAPNGYRVRLVNDTGRPRNLTLHLRACSSTGCSFECDTTAAVMGRTVLERHIVTDWATRFDVVSTASPVDPLRFLIPGLAGGRCTMVATLHAEGQVVDEITIVQPLAE